MILYVISVGLSVTMGLMGFINLAHGVFAMAGGYVLSTAMARLGMPFPVALLMAFIVVALGSIVLERLLYSRLYTAGELTQVLLPLLRRAAVCACLLMLLSLAFGYGALLTGENDEVTLANSAVDLTLLP